MKKVLPICAFILIAAATVLTLYAVFIARNWSSGVQIAASLLMTLACATLLYLTIREQKGQKGRKSTIIMLGIAIAVSIAASIALAVTGIVVELPGRGADVFEDNVAADTFAPGISADSIAYERPMPMTIMPDILTFRAEVLEFDPNSSWQDDLLLQNYDVLLFVYSVTPVMENTIGSRYFITWNDNIVILDTSGETISESDIPPGAIVDITSPQITFGPRPAIIPYATQIQVVD